GGLGIDLLYQGVLVSVLTIAAYFVGHFMESGVWEIAESPDGISMAFLTMSMAEIFHSMNMRSQRGSIFKMNTQNWFLWGAMILALVLTTLVIEVPFLANLFEFETISIAEYFVALGIAFMIIPIVEIVKFIQRKIAKN
ncbi:MAG: ATPase, partial [Ruminococcaceae bacterium]|nr:ATPase [Oscillospiraceae bacterium]